MFQRHRPPGSSGGEPKGFTHILGRIVVRCYGFFLCTHPTNRRHPKKNIWKTPLDSRSDIFSLGLLTRLLTGNRFRLVCSKCTRKNPADRYSNVEQLQKAINHYFLPLKISFVLALLLSTAVFGKMFYDKYDELKNIRSLYESQQNVESFRDSVIRGIDLKFDPYFSDCLKSIEDAEYMEDANAVFGRMYAVFPEIKDSLANLTTDPALKTVFVNYFMLKFEEFYKQAKDSMFSKPLRAAQE